MVASQSKVSEIRKCRRELDEFNQEAAKRKEKMYSILNSSLDMLLLHKSNVDKQLDSLKQHIAVLPLVSNLACAIPVVLPKPTAFSPLCIV